MVGRGDRQRDACLGVRIEQMLSCGVPGALLAGDVFLDGRLVLRAQVGVGDRWLPQFDPSFAAVLVAANEVAPSLLSSLEASDDGIVNYHVPGRECVV